MAHPSTRFRWTFLAPHFWPTWIGFALLRLTTLLPYPAILALGKGIGRMLYHIAGSRREVARVNLARCMPELSESERERVVKENFEATALSLFEGALSWWGSKRRLLRLHRVEGMEIFAEALARGKGVLLLGGHYTTLGISAGLMACHIRHLVWPVFKPAKNPLFEWLLMRARLRNHDGLVVNTDLREAIRVLKRGLVVWYAPDQDFGADRSVFAPFMGEPAATLTTTARLAKLSGAPVIPFYSQRLPGSQGYLTRFGHPLANFPSGDDVVDATAVNRAIEEQVRAAPEQYLWLHKRFKTRPAGLPELYR